MGEIIKKPRGTQDYINDDKYFYDKVVDIIRSSFEKYNINIIDIPTFEETKLFIRSVGESSDIVNKELFNLVNKGEHDQSLRPEFTAGIMRSVIENKLYATPDLPIKLGYYGPVFRYERPQRGRFRELHQAGVEFLDNHLDFVTIIDCISAFYNTAKEILHKDCHILINFIGSGDSRKNWIESLKSHFAKFLPNMCEDCHRRYEINPLRILDCKVEYDHELAKDAPVIKDFLSDDERKEYNLILKQLEELNIPYVEDSHLVRGLDYYTGVVFELYVDDFPYALGGGGQYKNLTKDLNGPEMEGIGFSFGLDRLLLTMDEQRKTELLGTKGLDFLVYSFNQTENGLFAINKVLDHIRKAGKSGKAVSLSKSFNGTLKQANRENVKYLVLVNEDLTFEVKNFNTRTQEKFTENELIEFIRKDI